MHSINSNLLIMHNDVLKMSLKDALAEISTFFILAKHYNIDLNYIFGIGNVRRKYPKEQKGQSVILVTHL